MTYRDDHEAALLRIDALERENQTLVLENARLRRMPPPSRPVVAPPVIAPVAPPAAAHRPQPQLRPEMTDRELIVGGVMIAIISLLSVCNP